jgi:hypothetical protein
MINHTTKIEVLGKTPTQLYDFMFSLDKKTYIAWHPLEHKDFMVLKETKNIVGSLFRFHEQIDNMTVKYTWEVAKITPNQKIVMKAKYFIPLFLILQFEETPNGTMVIHTLHIGFKNQFSGFIDWFITRFIFTKNRQNASDRHAYEEFKNLEILIK